MSERQQGLPPESGYTPTEGLTIGEDLALVDLLSKWTGGRISAPVFTELARIIPQSIVEIVVLRKNGDKLETLLIPRPEDDIVWPGMYHTPGAALRTADFHRSDLDPLNGPFERVQKGELKCEFAYRPVFAGRVHRLAARGAEIAEIYFVELAEGAELATNDVWGSVDELGQNEKFIQHQLGHVLMAAEQYSRFLQSKS